MEPSNLAEIQCSADALDSLYLIVQRRRGHVISETAKPGSPLYTVKCNIPVIESFGFSTDLRCFIYLEFTRWDKLSAAKRSTTGHYWPEIRLTRPSN